MSTSPALTRLERIPVRLLPDHEAIATEGWTAPHGNVNNWATMVATYPNSAKLANIQCENCHGPNLESTLHINGSIDSARVSLSSDVCGACHGEPARHGRYQQWEESGHAKYDPALLEGTVEGRGATAAHCGRCHSGQGFIAWIEQGDLTKQIQGAGGNATTAELTALGLTAANVHPITCATCHDPHAEGSISSEPNNTTVRVMDDTGMLPAGFEAVAVGRGALCITCHNTRNGAHNDTTGIASYSAPHVAAQADVLMGQNAYFVEVGDRSPHSFIQDSCTHCHMELTPPPAEFSYNLSGTNHSFKASITICSQCHGVFDGNGLQNATRAEIESLKEELQAAADTKIAAKGSLKIRGWDAATDKYTSSGSTDANLAIDLTAHPLDSVELVEIHGQAALQLNFANAMTVTWADSTQTTTDTIGVQLGTLKDSANVALYANNGNFMKAVWNMLLLENDNSWGVHNPAFTGNVINATMAQDLTF